MSVKFPFSVHLKTPESTALLASAIAPLLEAGDTLLLRGEIGAGKTHFVRSLIQNRLATAGRHEDVPSPTYTLVQTYQDDNVEIWHADLYRLTDEFEVAELGLTDAFRDAICLVEWPELLQKLRPRDSLQIEFVPGPGDDERVLTFTSDAGKWSKIKPALTRFSENSKTND